eukprot:Sdes_comp21881_c0_seq1m20425
MASKNILGLCETMLNSIVGGNGFGRVMKTMKVLSATEGHCVCELTIQEEHENRMGSLHGGMTATLIDVVSTLSVALKHKEHLPGVSVDMTINYLNPGKEGDTILIDARCIKIGKTLAFTETTITSKLNQQTIAKGLHTKYVG